MFLKVGSFPSFGSASKLERDKQVIFFLVKMNKLSIIWPSEEDSKAKERMLFLFLRL